MRLVCTTVAILLVSALSYAADKPQEPPKRKIDFDASELKFASGRVLAVTKTSIMIKVENSGTPSGVKTFPFHDRLASGTFQKGIVGESSTYLPTDVQAGDIVSLGVITENKQVFCVDISIGERPDGLIPASQVVDKERPWYQWMNAQIALRDKGIPIPEHLKPIKIPPPPKTPDPLKK